MRLSPRFLMSLATGGMLLALPDPGILVHAETAAPTPTAPVSQPEAPKQEAPKQEAPKSEPARPDAAPAPKEAEGPKPESKPADTKPADTKPADPKPAAPKPAETTPAPAAPVQQPNPADRPGEPAAQPKPAGPPAPSSVLPVPGRSGEEAIVPTREEMEFLELCNKERVARGLSRLTYDTMLTKVAREHSAEMRDKSYFNHESPTEGIKTPLDRYLRAVYHRPSYACVGENLFWATVIDVKRGHKAFMDSPTHRENILFPRYERMGVGIVKRNGEFWVTEMFVTNTDPVSVARNKMR